MPKANHAQGVAAAAHLSGAPALIVMPDDAPDVKRAGVERWHGDVVSYDRNGGESREEVAGAITRERGLALVKPFDDALIMAGQGTVGLELMTQAAARGAVLDQVLVPCGGGGLTAGVATAVRAAAPETAVYTVEPEGFDDTARSLCNGQRQPARADASSFCDALLAPQPGELTFAVNRRLCAGGLVVSDGEASQAMALAFLHLKAVIEPGGAVALAAALSGKLETRDRITAVVASGGNVDPAVYARAIDAA